MLILPDELIVEILSRLPIKSVLRFKCVSKSWHSFINDPNFVKLHGDRYVIGNDYHRLLVTDSYYSIIHGNGCDDDNGVVEHKFPFEDEQWQHLRKSVGYCNGLLCFLYGDKEKLILWNPCTSEYQYLPDPPPHKCLTGWILSWGFGFHPKTEEYKVVRIDEARRQDNTSFYESEVQVYTIGNGGSWRRLGNIPYRMQWPTVSSSQALFNGILHWTASKFNDYLILSFNIEDEQFGEVQLPGDLNEHSSHSVICTLGFLRGCLSMVVDTKDIASPREIWMMKDYGVTESWTKLFTINLHTPSYTLLRLFDNGELLFYNWMKGELFLYSLEHETTRNFVGRTRIQSHKLILEEINFVGSLVSPKQIDRKQS